MKQDKDVITEGSTTMRFSIYLNPQTRGGHQDVDIIQTITRQTRQAIDAGFVGVTLTEHHFSNYNTYGNPFLLASYLAPQLPPGTMFALSCAVPPLWNPMRLAQSINILDILTQGHAITGFAAGGSPLEYSGVGRDPSIRQVENAKTIEIVEKALAKKPEDPPLAWATAVESGVVQTRVMPGPYSDSGSKFARATQSNEGAEQTGLKGWYLFTGREQPEAFAERFRVYEEALRRSGLSEDEIQHRLDWSFVQKQVYLADTNEEALADIHPILDELADNQKKAFTPVSGVKGADTMQTVLRVAANDHEAFIREALIVGDAETFVEEIRKYEAAGIRHLTLVFNWGFMSAEQSDRSLQLFIDRVLPHFQNVDVPAAV
jgi:alkanesulfonate monooxygenase SsuD/methylene tetrahydromethanopterin reductase-like flavin-dependent oxidoreductase (luciferase family)